MLTNLRLESLIGMRGQQFFLQGLARQFKVQAVGAVPVGFSGFPRRQPDLIVGDDPARPPPDQRHSPVDQEATNIMRRIEALGGISGDEIDGICDQRPGDRFEQTSERQEIARQDRFVDRPIGQRTKHFALRRPQFVDKARRRVRAALRGVARAIGQDEYARARELDPAEHVEFVPGMGMDQRGTL